jgi:wyosine [tRNA(Phe)-imidazoG37] synthetase (radical SAM superfamily)
LYNRDSDQLSREERYLQRAMIQFIEMEKGEHPGSESLSPKSRRKEYERCKTDWKRLEEMRAAASAASAAPKDRERSSEERERGKGEFFDQADDC